MPPRLDCMYSRHLQTVFEGTKVPDILPVSQPLDKANPWPWNFLSRLIADKVCEFVSVTLQSKTLKSSKARPLPQRFPNGISLMTRSMLAVLNGRSPASHWTTSHRCPELPPATHYRKNYSLQVHNENVEMGISWPYRDHHWSGCLHLIDACLQIALNGTLYISPIYSLTDRCTL